MLPPLPLVSDYQGAFIFTNPFSQRSAVIREAGAVSPGHQPSRAPGCSAPQAAPVRLRIRCCVTRPRSHRNLYWSKTKDVRLQRALPHSKGSLSHSHKALQLAIEPSDYVIHTKNTLHSHQLFTSLLSFFPAGQDSYLMCVQRRNKISITRMVNLHSQSTSSLLFSPKIEIRREKNPQALKLGRNGRKSYLESQGTLSICSKCKLFSTPTFLSYSSHQN